MSSSTKHQNLSSHLQILVGAVENLKMKRRNITKLIETQEESKTKLETDIENLKKKLNKLDNTLVTLKCKEKELDDTISKSEEAIEKIEENADLLLALTKRTGEDVDKALESMRDIKL